MRKIRITYEFQIKESYYFGTIERAIEIKASKEMWNIIDSCVFIPTDLRDRIYKMLETMVILESGIIETIKVESVEAI